MEIRKKEFAFKGKSIDELKSLEVREFAKFLNSRQRRTVLRQFQEIEKFINRSKVKIGKNKPVKTHDRAIIIVPQMVGMKIHVHSGNKFSPIEVTGEMLGHRLGEFALTRSKVTHSSAGIGATKGSTHKSKK